MRAALLAVLFTAGCATPTGGSYDEPYGLVESGSRSAARKEAPALINKVDGRTPLYSRGGEVVKPGKHVLELYFSSGESAGVKHSRILELDVAPCTRYRIVAAYTSLTHVDWEPVVYPEPIGECLTRFYPDRKP
jgi:hypothetical protein